MGSVLTFNGFASSQAHFAPEGRLVDKYSYNGITGITRGL